VRLSSGIIQLAESTVYSLLFWHLSDILQFQKLIHRHMQRRVKFIFTSGIDYMQP